MSTALAVPGAMDLAELADVQVAARFIYYLGVMDLGRDVPARKYEVIEDTGEVLWVEPADEYITRIWDKLPRETKGLVIRAGLQKASVFRDSLSDGIQLVVYRARRYGWWVTTDDAGGGTDAAYRQWVKDAITSEGGSLTEASQLATTILNLEYLEANGYDADVEAVFEDRSMYNRYRRVASGMRRLIEAAKERPSAGDVRESIQEIVDAVNDPANSLDDLDRVGRIKPTLPPVVIEMDGEDGLGRHTFTGVATDAQLARLKSRVDGVVDWRLKGERYGVTDHVLAEYRTDADGLWRREYGEGEGWSGFVSVDEIPDGYPEGAPFEDPDWGTRYVRQWERKES